MPSVSSRSSREPNPGPSFGGSLLRVLAAGVLVGLFAAAPSASALAPDGALWIATENRGLARFSQGQFQLWTTETGLASNRVNALVEAADGTLWVGTTSGLQRWDGTALREGPPFDKGHVPVRSLAMGPDGTLWAGTEDGTVYQLREERMQPVPEASLPGAPIEALLAR